MKSIGPVSPFALSVAAASAKVWLALVCGQRLYRNPCTNSVGALATRTPGWICAGGVGGGVGGGAGVGEAVDSARAASSALQPSAMAASPGSQSLNADPEIPSRANLTARAPAP